MITDIDDLAWKQSQLIIICTFKRVDSDIDRPNFLL